MSNNVRTVTSICRAKNRIDIRNRRHVLAQLEAEGQKRLESFPFERLFLARLHEALDPCLISTGWSFESDRQNTPFYWFKLICAPNTDRLNFCDRAVINYLTDSGCKASLVCYDFDERELYGCSASSNSGRDWVKLDELLSRLLERKEPSSGPRDYSEADRSRRKAPVKFLDGNLSDDELTRLAISRLLINCYLYPWFGKQPMDIDAAYLFGKQVRFIEFKRKYPERSSVKFGLDERPHGEFVDWLSKHNSLLTHLILCDPLWDKNVSPTSLLRADSKTAPYALWIGGHLTPNSFESGHFHTYGTDSGMLGGSRDQRIIRLDNLYLVGEGVHSTNLAAFLNGQKLPVVTRDRLETAHRSAQSIVAKSG